LTEVLLLVEACPWLEVLVWALTVVVVLPSVVVWFTLPLAGRGISWPLTVKVVWLVEVFVPSAGVEFKESSETEDSDETEEEGVKGAVKLCTAGPALAAAVWCNWWT
jgi:hypothetical protein